MTLLQRRISDSANVRNSSGVPPRRFGAFLFEL